MANTEIDIDPDDIFHQVMQNPAVDAAVYKKAATIARTARRLERELDTPSSIRIAKHPLPSGRVSYDVISDDPAGEYGTSRKKRKAALRRAAYTEK